MAFITIPTILLANNIGDIAYRQAWETPKYFTTTSALMLLQGVAVFMAMSALPLLAPGRRRESAPWPGLTSRTLDRMVKALRVLYWITLFGYIVYGLVGVARGARPAMLLNALVSQSTVDGELKELFAPVSGVTTLTQVGIAYVVIAVVVLLHRKEPGLGKGIALMVFLGLFRAFFLSERLALLELIVPVVALLVVAFGGHPRFGIRAGLRLMPVVLMPLAIVMFAMFEYSRSWQVYQRTIGGSFADFAISRFSGYYVTAYNNGQIAFNWEEFPGRLPLRTLEWFWTAPVVNQIDLYDRLSGGSDLYQTLLVQWGNKEFNNPGGVFDPFVDYGAVGGVVWFALAGLFLGIAYRGFTNGNLWAVLVFPPLFTGLLELPRYIYWTQGRWLPALAALLFVAWYAQRSPKRGADPPTPAGIPLIEGSDHSTRSTR